MSGFLFWFFLIVNLSFIVVGIIYYIKDKKCQVDSEDNKEVKIWGLKPSTFYIISMSSLIILFILYENPMSEKWNKQHRIDSEQNDIIDSLLRENTYLKKDVNDMRNLLDLHNKLDEQLIKVSGKRDVIIINNRHPRPRHCGRVAICCDSLNRRICP